MTRVHDDRLVALRAPRPASAAGRGSPARPAKRQRRDCSPRGPPPWRGAGWPHRAPRATHHATHHAPRTTRQSLELGPRGAGGPEPAARGGTRGRASRPPRHAPVGAAGRRSPRGARHQPQNRDRRGYTVRGVGGGGGERSGAARGLRGDGRGVGGWQGWVAGEAAAAGPGLRAPGGRRGGGAGWTLFPA